MATWDPSVPSLNNDISGDLSKISDNFTILGTAWNGDHQDLATDGSASTQHEKVTLPETTKPTRIADTGIVYTKDVSGTAELFYLDDDDTGGIGGHEVQMTSNGVVKGGADAYISFKGDDVSIYGTAVNATVARTAKGKYEITLTGMTSTDYVVNATVSDKTAAGGGSRTAQIASVFSKTQTTLVIYTQCLIISGTSLTNEIYDPQYVDVVIYQV